MYLKETEWKAVHWIHLTLDKDQSRAPVNTVMNLRVQYIARNFLTNKTTISFVGRIPWN
jgi:hypothetical protein